MSARLLEPFPGAPPGARLTRRTEPVARSKRKTSPVPFVSAGSRPVAFDSKATRAPSEEIDGSSEPPSTPGAPLGVRDTSVVVPATTSRRNTSVCPFPSLATRLEAVEANATKRPSFETSHSSLGPFAWTPPAPTLTRTVVSSTRSRRNTSSTPFVSPGTRSGARLENTTYRPSELTDVDR